MKLEERRHRATAKAKGMSPEITRCVGGRYCSFSSRQNSPSCYGQGWGSPTGSETVSRCQKKLSMNSGEPVASHPDCSIKPIDGKIEQVSCRQSDYPIVSVKLAKASGEKGIAANTWEAGETFPGLRTGTRMKTKLASLTLRAKENPKAKFSSLMHLMSKDFLIQCFSELKRDKASGIDGVTVSQYEVTLKENVANLVKRLKDKSYRPKPARRTYIPKLGSLKGRPLGIPSVEGKIVQMGVAKILSAIFEVDFLDVSYGFRPSRSCHDALDKLNDEVDRKPVNYIADLDIEDFFGSVDHSWLLKCLSQRITDSSLLRLIVRFLKGGIVEEGKYIAQDKGTPQGSILSPVLSNIYLHFVLDLWFERVIKAKEAGYCSLIRYADDYVACFEKSSQAVGFAKALKGRLAKFGLTISRKKSKVILFGRRPFYWAKKEGKKLKTFDFLGFTHYCTQTRKGKFRMGRMTARYRFRAKAKELNLWLKKVRNMVKLAQWWKILRVKLLGHYRYYGISGNYKAIDKYYRLAIELAYKWVNRRSQKKSYNWAQFGNFIKYNPLPKPKIYRLTYTLSP